jgi:hypothetical protein
LASVPPPRKQVVCTAGRACRNGGLARWPKLGCLRCVLKAAKDAAVIVRMEGTVGALSALWLPASAHVYRPRWLSDEPGRRAAIRGVGKAPGAAQAAEEVRRERASRPSCRPN